MPNKHRERSSIILSALEDVISIDMTMVQVSIFVPWTLWIYDSYTISLENYAEQLPHVATRFRREQLTYLPFILCAL